MRYRTIVSLICKLKRSDVSIVLEDYETIPDKVGWDFHRVIKGKPVYFGLPNLIDYIHHPADRKAQV